MEQQDKPNTEEPKQIESQRLDTLKEETEAAPKQPILKSDKKWFVLSGITLVVIILFGWVWFALGNDSDNNNYSGGVDFYLDAATDDNLSNYYKLGLVLTDIVFDSCDVSPSISIAPIYSGNNLLVNINYELQEIERESNGLLFDVCGEATPNTSFDLEKDWLVSPGGKTINAGSSKTELSIDNYQIYIDGIARVPYYPDQVGVLNTFPCEEQTPEDLLNTAEQYQLPLADNQYPGLDNNYRRPGKELHVISDSINIHNSNNPLASTSTGCSIRLSKPILKSLGQDLIP